MGILSRSNTVMNHEMKRFPNRRVIQTAAFGLAVMLAAGCTSINKDAASKLASEGSSVANTVGQSYQSTSDDLTQYVEGEYLLSAIAEGHSPPSDAMLADIKTIQSELQLRKQLLGGLGDLYSSFGALCSYDAQGEVEKSLGATIQAGNGLATQLGGGAISDSAGKLFADAGGAVAGAVQSDRIKNASAKIRSALQGIIFLLEKSNDQVTLVGIRKEISVAKLEVAKKLWEGGFASANGVLDRQVQDLGLTPNESALSVASKNQGMQAGVEAILVWRQKQEVAAEADAYASTIQALRSLVNEHAKIEAGESVSLGTVQGYLATVQQYVDLVSDIRKGK